MLCQIFSDITNLKVHWAICKQLILRSDWASIRAAAVECGMQILHCEKISRNFIVFLLIVIRLQEILLFS